MKILYISGREPTYTRNAVILRGLKESKVDIVDCTSEFRSYSLRYPHALTKLFSKRDYDLTFVGFFGQPLMPIIKKMVNTPIIFDAFLSSYDTMCFDRKKFKPMSMPGQFFYYLDRVSCDLADRVILDTNQHIDYFVETFGLDKNKFQRVFVGADDYIFHPITLNKDPDKFKIFYYGTYLPLHGINHIVKAAKMLESYEDIEFKLVGKGLQSSEITELSKKLKNRNITFVDWIPYYNLPMEISKSDICLGGHFSDNDKAKRTIAGKTFQFISMKKPVILGDNNANKELFENNKNALLVEPANPRALADAILELRDNDNLRKYIAEGGYTTYREKCTPLILGTEIKTAAYDLLKY